MPHPIMNCHFPIARVFASLCLSLVAGTLNCWAGHPYLLFTSEQIDPFKDRVSTPGSLNQKYFDRIALCPDSVPGPAPGWNPPMREFRGTPHSTAVETTRRSLMSAAHSALKYALDPEAYPAFGSSAKACAMDVIAKWDPQQVILQYRDKTDGNADEHEAAQFIIYMALTYDMAYDQFSKSERQRVIDWIARGAVDAGESESDYYPEYEHYARQNHPAACILACSYACLALKDELHLITDPDLRKRLETHLVEMNERIPSYILDGAALTDGRPWEGSAYGSYTLTFALLWGRAYNNLYAGNVFTGRGVENIIEWYGHSRASFGPNQLVEYGDDYDRYGAFGEMLILFEQGNADGYDLWMLHYLHSNGDIFDGPSKTEQAYTDAFLTYPLFYPTGLDPIPPQEAGDRPTRYFRDFSDKSGGEIHFKNQFMDTPDGTDTVQLVLYSHRDEISKGGLAQGSIRFYAYGEKFTEEEGRMYKDKGWWGTMKHFTTFDYFHPDCGHDGSLPKFEFYANRKNPGLGRVGAFIAGDFADYARADGRFPLGDPSLNAAYHRNTNRFRIACSPTDDPSQPTYCEPVIKADRMVMMLKSAADNTNAANPYFVIVDDYDIDGEPQKYRWRWHAPRKKPTRKGRVEPTDGTPNDFTITGAGSIDDPFQVFDPALDKTRVEITFTSPDNYDYEISQFAPEGSVNHRMLEVTKTARNPVFFSILYPRKKGFARPDIRALKVSGDGGTGSRIAWDSGLIDTVVSGRGQTVSGGDMVTNARMASVRTLDGDVENYVVAEGSQLVYKGVTLVSDVEGTGSISMSGDELVLSGSIASGRFYGPEVTSIRLEEKSLPVVSEGNFIRFERPANSTF